MSARFDSAGAHTESNRAQRADWRDLKFPSGSLQHNFDHFDEPQPRFDLRDLVLVVFFSLLFAIPLLLAGLMIANR